MELGSVHLAVYGRTRGLQRYRFQASGRGPQNAAGGPQTVIKTYLCPSDIVPLAAFSVTDGFGNSVAMAGTIVLFGLLRRRRVRHGGRDRLRNFLPQ